MRMRQCFPLDFPGGRGCFDKASRRIQYGLVARPSKPYLPAMEPDSQPLPKRPLTEILFLVFMRLVAVSCFWFGLQYWAMLTGYSLGGHGRFDMLNLPWRVAGSALAVIFPVAALGLWLGASWGQSCGSWVPAPRSPCIRCGHISSAPTRLYPSCTVSWQPFIYYSWSLFGSISARMKSAQELIYHKNKAIQPGFRSNFIAKSLICNAW